MKIIDIKTHVLTTPLDEPFSFSMGWVRQRSAVLVELLTDDGVTGWGESLCHGLQPPQIAATIINHALKPVVVGQDPFDVEEDIAYIHAVRDAIGRGPKLMIDANHAYNVGSARRILKAIESADIHWFEEPISPGPDLRSHYHAGWQGAYPGQTRYRCRRQPGDHRTL